LIWEKKYRRQPEIFWWHDQPAYRLIPPNSSRDFAIEEGSSEAVEPYAEASLVLSGMLNRRSSLSEEAWSAEDLTHEVQMVLHFG